MESLMRAAFAAAVLSLLPVAAQARPLGPDAAACEAGEGPAILVNVSGLKDRAGEVKVELYPAAEGDFLKDDRDLLAQGKVFRRIRVPTPKAGPVELCIRAPGPGRYGLLFTHNRDSKNKFDYKIDGAGVPSNQRIGFSKPKLAGAVVTVGEHPVTANIRVQYLGLLGFGPSGRSS